MNRPSSPTVQITSRELSMIGSFASGDFAFQGVVRTRELMKLLVDAFAHFVKGEGKQRNFVGTLCIHPHVELARLMSSQHGVAQRVDWAKPVTQDEESKREQGGDERNGRYGAAPMGLAHCCSGVRHIVGDEHSRSTAQRRAADLVT